ncbi:MAG: DUF4405 domain-containing protein [Anaerolineae bacterium]|jgi:hypothetical protein|nr:DUF4405 domain-containing protein [Anaerolineae bacterium]
MNKSMLNYWLDIVVGLAFVLAAVTGIAFLFMGSGGYQGGRNALFQVAFLGIARDTWSDLHTLSSLVMTAGVGLHLVFHFNWIVCVTKRMLHRPVRKTIAPALQREESCPVTA